MNVIEFKCILTFFCLVCPIRYFLSNFLLDHRNVFLERSVYELEDDICVSGVASKKLTGTIIQSEEIEARILLFIFFSVTYS